MRDDHFPTSAVNPLRTRKPAEDAPALTAEQIEFAKIVGREIARHWDDRKGDRPNPSNFEAKS